MPASQLTAARVNSADYSYAYDAIGNRTSATEAGTRTAYTANKLNQYTAEGSFRPTFDADGNQTLIKTSTGTWNVTYNAKNRPILFTKSDGSVTVECTYDTMGRRATKKVTTNGTLTEHRRFLYRGYLQIDSPPPHRRLTPSGQSRFAHCPTGLTAVGRLACCDLTRAYTPALWFITWDPTQETATRPLAIQKNGTWYTYGWDLTKNICETYRTDGRIDLAYTYTPYGEVIPAHAYDQPLRWSSEYHDVELGLVYYNYRHYNPAIGRWTGRDLVPQRMLYAYALNNPANLLDSLGLSVKWSKTIKAYNENKLLDDDFVGSITLSLKIDEEKPKKTKFIKITKRNENLFFDGFSRNIKEYSDGSYDISFSGNVHATFNDTIIPSHMLTTTGAFGAAGAWTAGTLSASTVVTGGIVLIFGAAGLLAGACWSETRKAYIHVEVVVPVDNCGGRISIGKIYDNIPITRKKVYEYGDLYFNID